MEAIVLSYKRVPHTTLYDSMVMLFPEGEVLAETTAQHIDEALTAFRNAMLEYPHRRVGFKKQRVERELTDLSGDIFMATDEEAAKFRADLVNLTNLYVHPSEMVLPKKEG